MALTTIPSELSSVSGISDSSSSTAITIDSSQNVTFAGNITTGSNTISGVLSSVTGSIGSAATATTQAASDNSTKLATTAYVTTALANLVDSAPGTLNTLNELAAALGDDANFSTTVTNSIATKLPLAGGTMTGNIAHAGTFTIDVGGNLVLDADGGDILLHDGGTLIGQFALNNTGNFDIYSAVSDADIRIRGNDGGSTVTALTFDISDGGRALFGSSVALLSDTTQLQLGAGNDFQIGYDGTDAYIRNHSGGQIILRARTGFLFQANATGGGADNAIQVTQNGAVTLYHDGSAKLATTSAGINLSSTLISSDTSDGSDNKSIMINGGGAASDSRGGYVIVHGNEHSSNPGLTRIHAGNVGSAEVQLFTAGTQRVTVDSSGNVGIGVLDPGDYDSRAERLVVGESGDAGITIACGSSSDARLVFAVTNQTDLSNGSITYNQLNDSMAFETAGTARATINTNGTLNISASTSTHGLSFGAYLPSAGQTLLTYHDGNTRSGLGIVPGVHRMFTNTGAVLSFGEISTSDGSTYTERMRIDANSNVGIGTSSPGAVRLNVQTAANGNLAGEFVNTHATGSYGLKIRAGSSSSNYSFAIADKDNATTHFFFRGDGNLGIGTTTPSGKLHIQSSGNTIQYIHAGTNGSASLRLLNDAQHWDVNCQTNDKFAVYDHTSNTQPFTIMPSTNYVGIGTATPGAALDVNGGGAGSVARFKGGNNNQLNIAHAANSTWGLLLTNSDHTNNGGYHVSTSGNNLSCAVVNVNDDALHFGTDNTHRMTINHDGKVGIGTTSPNGKLDVIDSAYGVTYPIVVNNTLAGFNGRGAGIRFNSGSTNRTAIFYYHYGTTVSMFFDADLYRYRNLSSGATLMELNSSGNASLTGSLTQNTSDERLKDNITEIPNAIDKIKELKGVTFEWKGNGAKDFPHIDGTKDMGVIAQDVQKVLPEAVQAAPFDLEKEMEENSDGSFTEKLTSKSGEDYLTVHYEKLIPVLIQGMKEQQALIEALQTKVAALEGE